MTVQRNKHCQTDLKRTELRGRKAHAREIVEDEEARRDVEVGAAAGAQALLQLGANVEVPPIGCRSELARDQLELQIAIQSSP